MTYYIPNEIISKICECLTIKDIISITTINKESYNSRNFFSINMNQIIFSQILEKNIAIGFICKIYNYFENPSKLKNYKTHIVYDEPISTIIPEGNVIEFYTRQNLNYSELF